MRRTPLRRITPLKAKTGFKVNRDTFGKKKAVKRKNKPNKAMLELDSISYYKKIVRKHRYKNQIKDKAWSILSDYVRMRDFIKYKKCVSSGKPITQWRKSDAGHYISMGGHGAAIGFCDMNVHAQNKNDNRQASFESGAMYRDELVRRYGEGIIETLETIKRQTVKADDFYFIAKIKEIHKKFTQLKDEFPRNTYPDYL